MVGEEFPVLGEFEFGRAGHPIVMRLDYANRHGLISGATGTGKTISMQVLIEGFSKAGVPVICADVKGDVSGISQMGTPTQGVTERNSQLGIPEPVFSSYPTVFWDLFGEYGHRVRTTVTELGPLLLARILSLSEAQEGVLNVAVKVADDQGLLLLDLKDLRAILAHLYENVKLIGRTYGHVSRASIGSIQRKLLIFEQQGAQMFLGEPALDVQKLLCRSKDGRGYIHILDARRLIRSPRVYAGFLLWMFSELFEVMPEVGDTEIPRMVLFFDEAHVLFDGASKALLERIEQTVRLIRSRGVGIYFVSQSPGDVPDSVSSQLGNRVQHALRAYTPREEKVIRAAASTFRPNAAFDTEQAIKSLGIGEALVSFLTDDGVPSIVQRTLVRAPASRIGPCTAVERAATMQKSPLGGLYDESNDRESAFELLSARLESQAGEDQSGGFFGEIFKSDRQNSSTSDRVARSVARSVLSSVGGQIAADVGRSIAGRLGGRLGRSLFRGILGGVFRRR